MSPSTTKSWTRGGPEAERADGEGVAVVIPCHNEEKTIEAVVDAFRRELPAADIVVVDNASTDATAAAAAVAGARVVRESRRGKGFALVTGFAQASAAEVVVMVDGDDTYPAGEVGRLLEAVARGADMVIGARTASDARAYRPGHSLGNKVFNGLVRWMFGLRTRDLFSGYRAMTRRFLDTCPLITQGFEIETELSLQALVNGFHVVEVPVEYRARPTGSHSKLRTVSDGSRILLALVAFFRDYRPLTLFGIWGLTLFALGLAAGGVVVKEYIETGQVLRLPLAVLAVGLVLLSAVSWIGGLLLSSIRRRNAELAFLLTRSMARRDETRSERADPFAG